LVLAAIVGGGVLSGVLIIWGGYEFASNLYEEYQERQQYEEYVRSHYKSSDDGYSYQKSYRQRMNNDFEFEDDRDLTDHEMNEKNEEDDPYTFRNNNRSSLNDQYELRNRRGHSQSSLDNEKLNSDQYELSEMENSINERRRRLMAEQAFLDREEEMLQSRWEALRKNTESELNNSSSTITNATSIQHPLGDSFNPFMDAEEDSAMNSFSDEFQNSLSITGKNASDDHKQDSPVDHCQQEEEKRSKETMAETTAESGSLYHSLSSYTEPQELRFPIPSTADAQSERSDSTIPSRKGLSDTEESWDAVSEEDWLKSVDGSDEDHHFSD
jgi:hypothetical protein